MAHLEELIVRHGMLERVDDEILERDKRTAKRIKADLLYWGGSSDPQKSTVKYVAFKEVTEREKGEGEGEAGVDEAEEGTHLQLVESERRRNKGQGEQFARLMWGHKALLAERL
eukprot:6192652-Pleurochrysis_carterae.AAC.2